jgi:hypothetical protein
MHCDPSNSGRESAAPPQAAEQAENRVFGVAISEQKVEILFAPSNIRPQECQTHVAQSGGTVLHNEIRDMEHIFISLHDGTP